MAWGVTTTDGIRVSGGGGCARGGDVGGGECTRGSKCAVGSSCHRARRSSAAKVWEAEAYAPASLLRVTVMYSCNGHITAM